ncbi:MAG TPA: hypothetical protein VFA20_13985 [Myxococcaceae bacterium]|nr:hypothetical protein [Myxococcaceae bacterium]
MNVLLCPMNSGCTVPFPHPRGRETFLPMGAYRFEDRARLGADAIVELAVAGGVPDIEELVVRVDEEGAGEPAKQIWRAAGKPA